MELNEHRSRATYPIDQNLARSLPRLMSIDALRGFDMFWIVGGDRIAREHWQMVGHAAEPALRRAIRAREVGRVPVLRSDLPAVPVPGRRRLAVLAEEVSGRVISPKRAAYVRIARRVLLLFLLGLIYNNMLQFRFELAAIRGRLAADRDLLRNRGGDLSAHEGAHAGDLVSRDSGGLLGHPDVRALARVASGRLDDGNKPGRLPRPALPAGQDQSGLLRLRRQRRAALDDPGGGHCAARCAGRPVAGLEPGALDQGCWAWHCAGSLAWAWELCGAGDFPVIKILWTSTYVLIAGGWSLLLLALFYTIIDVIGLRLGVFLRRHRRQRDHDLHRVSGSFPFPRYRSFCWAGRPALGLVRPGAAGDRNAGDRMAAVAPSLPEPDFLAGLSSDGHFRLIGSV